MNWMLPLETLPGWPEAPEVSTPHMLLLMIIGPLVAGAVVALIAFTPALGRRFRGELVSETPDVGEHHVLEDAAAPSRAVIEPRGRHAEPELDA